jgi:hypothetical protein
MDLSETQGTRMLPALFHSSSFFQNGAPPALKESEPEGFDNGDIFSSWSLLSFLDRKIETFDDLRLYVMRPGSDVMIIAYRFVARSPKDVSGLAQNAIVILLYTNTQIDHFVIVFLCRVVECVEYEVFHVVDKWRM